MDCKCAYNNGSDRIRSAITGMGNGTAGVDCRSMCDAHVCLYLLLYVCSSRRLLPIRPSHFRQPKLYLHGCCPIQSWYSTFFLYITFYLFFIFYKFRDLILLCYVIQFQINFYKFKFTRTIILNLY